MLGEGEIQLLPTLAQRTQFSAAHLFSPLLGLFDHHLLERKQTHESKISPQHITLKILNWFLTNSKDIS